MLLIILYFPTEWNKSCNFAESFLVERLVLINWFRTRQNLLFYCSVLLSSLGLVNNSVFRCSCHVNSVFLLCRLEPFMFDIRIYYVIFIGYFPGKTTQQSIATGVSSAKVTLSSSSVNGLVTLSSSTAPSFSQLSSMSSPAATATVSSAPSSTTTSLLLGSRESPITTPMTTATGTVPSLQSFASSSLPVVQSTTPNLLPMLSAGQQQQQLTASFKFPSQTNDQQSKLLAQSSQLDADTKRLYPVQLSNGPQVWWNLTLLWLLVKGVRCIWTYK